MADDDPDRRKFLKVATCAVGGGLGLTVAVPAVRLLLDPSSKTTVTTPSEPLDLGRIERFKVGADPRRVDIVAPLIKDGWTTARNVVLGAAYVRRVDNTTIEALSGVCPHLGCAIGWVPGDRPTMGHYLCPCHDSKFDVGGVRKTGPSERDLDPLPVKIVDGRLQLTWVRYKTGRSTREPA